MNLLIAIASGLALTALMFLVLIAGFVLVDRVCGCRA
jgi:hypothetical protein